MKKPPVHAKDESMSAGLRRFLYFTAALTGACVLIIEILGAKLLSPFFGTSHFVWTAQIAVTLVSLSLGYYLGGRWVDQKPDLSKLYMAIGLAGVYLTAAVLFCANVSQSFLRFNLAMGSILASSFLFFVPLTLLAMTSPFLIRVMSSNMQKVGSQSGQLYAISTLGSVLGTVLVGYTLIPFFPNSGIMFGTAMVLIGLWMIYLFIWRRRAEVMGPALLGLLAIFFGTNAVHKETHPRFVDAEELFRINSNFGLMQVLRFKNSGSLYYLNDYLNQNSYDPKEQKSLAQFTYLLHGLSRNYTEKIENALCIGLGIGIVPMHFAREGVKVDVVEINEAVVPMAKKFFNFDPAAVQLFLGDGRYFLNQTTTRYDTVILDAFLGDGSPSHLMTEEAFQAIRKVLKPHGTLVINSFASEKEDGNFFGASLEKTLRAVFKSVRIHPAQSGNMFFVASSANELTAKPLYDLKLVHPSLRFSVESALRFPIESIPGKGMVLRDDYNPVDFYDAKNRENLRRTLALEVQKI